MYKHNNMNPFPDVMKCVSRGRSTFLEQSNHLNIAIAGDNNYTVALHLVGNITF